MRDNTIDLAVRMARLAHKIDEVRWEASAIFDTFPDTMAYTQVSGTAQNDDLVLDSEGQPCYLTKYEYNTAMDLMLQLTNLFNNQPVSQFDWAAVNNKLKTLV